MTDRIRVHVLDRENPYRSLSAVGEFQHYYVVPHCFWWSKNDRTLLTQTLTSVDVQDGTGSVQRLINAGSHNYTGLYSMTPESEELQWLCLEKLPFADVTAVPALYTAMNQAVCRHFSVDFCCSSSSGYGSNMLALPAILDSSWLMLMDDKSHSSMYAGAFLAETGCVIKFRHNDMIQLEDLLKEVGPKYEHVLVAIEGFYSMDGTIPALADLHRLKQAYGFVLYCDEAHSFLSVGSSGRGCLELWNEECPDSPMPIDLIDLRTATLSKVVGGLGGLVFGHARFEEAIRARSRRLHERGEEPVSTSTIIQTIYVLSRSILLERKLHRLRSITNFCRGELRKFHVHVYGNAVTPILPIHAGRPTMAAKLSYSLRRLGLLATPITVPAVKFWESRVRVTLSADFSDEQVNKLVDCIIDASRSCGIVKNVKAQRRTYTYTGNGFAADDEELRENAECFKSIHEFIDCDVSNQQHCFSSSQQTFERNCGGLVRKVGHNSRANYGLGSSGSRWVTGTFAPHLEVERTLAEHTQQEAAMTFANAEIGLSSTTAALCRPLLNYKHHYMLVPLKGHEKGHESIQEGLRIASRKEKPEIVIYADLEDMFAIMSKYAGRKTYFTVYMDTIAEDKLVDFKKIVSRLQGHKGQSGMTLLLDDSKGLGQHGPNRLGIAGCSDLRSAAQALGAQILVYGSFYQAFGLSGGFLAGSDVLIEELRFTSRGYMFSTSPQPYVMDMINKALRLRMRQGQQ